MLTYECDPNTIEINEVANHEDIEFHISLNNPEVHYDNLKKVQHYFEDNKVYTDALFYAFKNHQHKIIVRKDYYIDFIITLAKFRLIESVKWDRSFIQK